MRASKPAIRLTQCLALSSLLFSCLVWGEPYVPREDAVVLERLPAAPAARALQPLRRALQDDSTDLRSALQLAQGYLEIGRETSDPRFVSYAQAVIAPWMQQRMPPAAILVLQATALQNTHHFDEAIALLDRALVLEPDNAQAWLTKATLAQVAGDFDTARSSCRQLLQRSSKTIALTCLMSVESLTGKLAPSYQTLQRVAAADATHSALGAWIVGQLAEMAVRLGDFAAAERHFESALQLDSSDVYLQAAYADLLLLQNRNADVIHFLRQHESHDVLLLRLAIAAHRTAAPEARRWAELFDARRRATRPDDNPHLREHARFILEVIGQPTEALILARRNWLSQREPADVQLYARAARAAGSSADTRILQEWIEQTKYEDRTLQPNFRATAHASLEIQASLKYRAP
jgi:tetratricopeptide (TPR) repeat protein